MEEKRKVIVLLGDSLFAYHDQWGALDPEADIINLGRGGDNSVGTLRRTKTACGHKPDVVFLQAGINDLLQGIPTEDLVDRHLTIWRTVALFAPEARLIVSSFLPINVPMLRAKNKRFGFHGRLVRSACHALAKLAKIFRIEYVDAYSALVGRNNALPPPYTDDGLHLTPEGYEVWIDCLKTRLDGPPRP